MTASTTGSAESAPSAGQAGSAGSAGSAGPFAVRSGGADQLAGTGILLRFALRRDRVMVPVWVAVTGLMVLSMPNSLRSLYGTAAERADLMRQMTTNASLRALVGPVFDDSLGALTAWRVGVYAGLLAAIMSLLVVIRHTRDEEESGRQELIASGTVGRRAPLTAALLTAAVANGGLAALVTLGLAGQGAAGAVAFGLGIAGVGMVFATMAAVVAQLTESARLARGLTAGVLGLAFVLRAAGDSSANDGSSFLTWMSPLGWLENERSFADERWWVLSLFVAATLLQGAVAYQLAGRRDVGMSFLPTRPGPATGRLGTAGALAWRLQRGSVLGWSIGFFLAGLVYGGLTEGTAEFVGDNEGARQIFERMGGRSGLTDAFLASMIGMLGLIAALYVVAAVLRLHGEETSGRAEPLLANAVGRVRWAAGHLAVAFGGAVWIMLLAGLGFTLGYGKDAGPILAGCLVQVAGVWVVGGSAVLLYGLTPRAAPAAWGLAGAVLLIGWIGPALDAPRAVLDLSPFGHLPKLPGGEMEWTPVLVLTGIAVLLVAGGLAGLRRRDLSS
ncbi:ABC transporter permease [Streptomyces scabiei]|uniref:ABC transporter permease n=1 Tax=Streptomyces TaxID=1883 RepID=UPI0002E71A0D|nr:MULTISPECIES: ABC transporter permease [Streptomyces]MBP5862233.1 ABC transporter permease [Streptomyces sp. LBUM 1484]MBP5868824.1 ABC transporter permease [Streptomyces sp. LBUM 1485]MBP5877291.1 ABC transporter permease [Streptomyces sp. LBUM 1477]MBP5901113.1 ABC transporter permease [Streptomyces sp. LBUM 1488]MBP5915253.1 ABC transporter permease [Streptomyces sp. LBUM 1486]